MTQIQKKLVATSTLIMSVAELFSAAPSAQLPTEQELLEAVGHRDLQKVRHLIDIGIDTQATDPYGRMPIHLAARYGYDDIVRVLLENGALPYSADRFALTPLMYATHYGYTEVVQMLIAALDKTKNGRLINFSNSQGNTALHLATQKGQLEITTLLLQHPEIYTAQINRDGKTAFHLAIELQQLTIVNLFLEQNIDLDEQGNEIPGPNGESIFNHAAYASNPTIMHLLLEKRGAYASTQNTLGQTALHYAARCGKAELVDILAEYLNSTSQHATIDTTTLWNATALHWVSRFGHRAALMVLLKHGAVTDQKDINGKTPLLIATENRHIKTACALLIFGVYVSSKEEKKLAVNVPVYRSLVRLYRRKVLRTLEELNLGLAHHLLELIAECSVSSIQGEPYREQKEPEPAPIELTSSNSLRSRTAHRIKKFLTRTKHE